MKKKTRSFKTNPSKNVVVAYSYYNIKYHHIIKIQDCFKIWSTHSFGNEWINLKRQCCGCTDQSFYPYICVVHNLIYIFE